MPRGSTNSGSNAVSPMARSACAPGSSEPIPNFWSLNMGRCSSTRPSGFRRCPLPICRAAGRPTRWRRRESASSSRPNDSVSALVAIFNGNPAGQGFDAPQKRNGSGTNFRLSDAPLIFAEASYSYNQGKDAAWLTGAIKLGGYNSFERFNDQRFGTDGLSLADPASSGRARQSQGNSAIYVMLDQLLHRVEGTDDQGLGLFARLLGSPSARSSAIDLYADGGLTYKGLLESRPNDTAGIAVAYARLSDAIIGLDRDSAAFASPDAGLPIRSSEVLFEATYQAQIVPGFTVQPNLQYIVRPGGQVANPRDPAGGVIRNTLIVGVRASVRY